MIIQKIIGLFKKKEKQEVKQMTMKEISELCILAQEELDRSFRKKYPNTADELLKRASETSANTNVRVPIVIFGGNDKGELKK